MKQRAFSAGPLVSEVGLGTWQLGGDWGPVDEKTARNTLASAVDNGVTFIDTADVYGAGLSEERIGRFLQSRKDRVFIATKMGRSPNPGWPKNYRLFNFRQFIDGSLQRLGVPVIDLLQLHCIPFEYLKKAELYEWINILKKEGKVRYFGASVETLEEAFFCLQKSELSAIQIIFNIFRQDPAQEFLSRAKAKGVAVIVRLPFASGLLTGKFDKTTRFPEDDHRFFNRDGERFNVGETFAGIPFDVGLRLVEELKAMAPAGLSLAHLALRWVLDHDAVTTVIPGARSPQQAKANAAASDVAALPPEVHVRLQEWYREKVVPNIRGKY